MAKTRTILDQAQRKIARIRKHLATARGLTPKEADAAARTGLIPYDERWWWTEEWQKGERQAERDLKAGRLKVFDSLGELLQHLEKR